MCATILFLSSSQALRVQTSTLPNLWRLEKQNGRRSRRGADQQSFNPKIEHVLVKAICQFVLQLSPSEALTLFGPIVAMTAEFPAKAADLVNWLILTQGDKPEASTLWRLWQAFADAFRTSALVSSVDGERSAASKLLHELFLGANWKGQREWIPLRNDLHRLRGLFEALPPSRRLIRFYCYFLAHTGSPTLPDTLIGIKEKLSMSQDPNLLDDDAIFYLEQILGRLISGGNIRIRSDAQLRTTTLEILDAMVTRGSSAAYKLPDDFLTPIPLGVS